MNPTEILPAPELEPRAGGSTKWERERTAYRRLLPTLLASHRGEYVAIHEGQVIDHGPDQVALALRAYERFGYQPIYVGLVSDDPSPALRVPTPRVEGGRFFLGLPRRSML